MEVPNEDLYNSKFVLPNQLFQKDTDVSLNGKLPPSIIDILENYQEVFTKSLTSVKRTSFDAVALPIVHGKPPTRRAIRCRPTELHCKRAFDEMIDTLLASEMIEQVHKDAGPYLSEAFLVPKPKDPTGPLWSNQDPAYAV